MCSDTNNCENTKRVKFRCTDKSDKDFLTELIQLYRKLPSLWKVKCKKYKDVKLKEKQCEILLKKYRERYPDANKLSLKKKINSLRSNYRREKFRVDKLNKNRKYVESMGITTPSLWYYNDISFLDDDNDSRDCSESENQIQANCEIEEIEIENEIKFVDTLGFLDAQSLQSKAHNANANANVETPPTENDAENEIEDSVRKKQKTFIDTSEFLNSESFQTLIHNEPVTVDTPETDENTANKTEEPKTKNIVEPPLILSAQSLKEQSDNIEKLTNLWASKLRQMSSAQQLYAEKFIHEILFEGVLGNLNRNSVQINPTVSTTSPNSIIKLNRPLLGFLYESSNSAGVNL